MLFEQSFERFVDLKLFLKYKNKNITSKYKKILRYFHITLFIKIKYTKFQKLRKLCIFLTSLFSVQMIYIRIQISSIRLNSEFCKLVFT